ncbi:MAG: DNA-formamidopyrimidine glycosylase [Phycisphaerae bacterium]|nr:DNA-formamidopyrimidine glycosylase [Phycisphaerae bacterium]
MGEVYEAPMPELPEVETIRRRLEAHLRGASVLRALLRRRDVLRSLERHERLPRRGGGPERALRPRSAAAERSLLVGATIESLVRRGKQLALVAEDGRVLLVQLGMSGRLLLDQRANGGPAPWPAPRIPHTHAEWSLRAGERDYELRFVDPRRFGGLAALPTRGALDRHWSNLGPDALDLDATELAASLRRSKRPIKSLLLDQAIVAGIGNIYADEIMHRIAMHPCIRANRLAHLAVEFVDAIRIVLRDAIEQGGSTVRDYRDPSGDFGSYQRQHRVYGRAGADCERCRSRGDRSMIRRIVVAGRGTWFCPGCQPLRTRGPLAVGRLSTGHAQRI